jgi:pimeloyl-ACP methyl ester carboxylesterase
MQMAIRYPERVAALILIVPIAYKPVTVADSAPAPSALAERLLLSLIGSDFVYWSALHLARDQVIKRVLATPPEVVALAGPAEQTRVNAMLRNPTTWKQSAHQRWLSAPATTATAPIPTPSTPRVESPTRNSSATIAAAIYWSDIMTKCCGRSRTWFSRKELM